MDGLEKIVYVGAALFSWTVIFQVINYTVLLNRINKAKADDIRNRLVSMIHGALAFGLCAYILIAKPKLLKRNNSLANNIIQIISFSYFAYDMVACIYYKLMDKSLVLHHFICIYLMLMALLGFKHSQYIVIGLAITQVSNFPMHLRIILRQLDLKHTKLFQLAENLYLFLYIIARGIISPFIVLVPGLFSPSLHILFKIGLIGLQFQSFSFIADMIGIIQRKLPRIRQMKEKGIQYSWFTEDSQHLQALSFYKKQHKEKQS